MTALTGQSPFHKKLFSVYKLCKLDFFFHPSRGVRVMRSSTQLSCWAGRVAEPYDLLSCASLSRVVKRGVAGDGRQLFFFLNLLSVMCDIFKESETRVRAKHQCRKCGIGKYLSVTDPVKLQPLACRGAVAQSSGRKPIPS